MISRSSRGVLFRIPFKNVAFSNNSKCGFRTNSNIANYANIVTKSNVTLDSGNLSIFAAQFSSVGSIDIRKRLLLFNDRLVKTGFTPLSVRYLCSKTTNGDKGKSADSKMKENDKKKPPGLSLVDKKRSNLQANPVIDSLLYDKYRAPEPTTTAEKVTRNVKDFTYLIVLLGAVGVTSLLLWYGGLRDLFSSKTPSNVFSRALKDVQADDRVIDLLGNPIKGYGEETGRGRRRNVSHFVYIRDGVEHMKVVFYIKGPNGTATVKLEMKEVNHQILNSATDLIDFN